MSDGLTLEAPHQRWSASYLALQREFAVEGSGYVPWIIAPGATGIDERADFPGFVAALEGLSRGEGVPDGFVAHTTRWLVAGGSKVVAVINLRHRLTPRLRVGGGHIGYGVRPAERGHGYASVALALMLAEAWRSGLDGCLLVCDRDNPASARVIVKNGGVMANEYYDPDDGWQQRYWIAGPLVSDRVATV